MLMMNLGIVAEDVETVNQLNYLINQGCELIQWFLFSKPIPLEEVESIIQKYEIDVFLGTDYYQI